MHFERSDKLLKRLRAARLDSSSTPDGNGSELSTITYGYDADGEQTSKTSPDGNLVGANVGNFTTTTAYDADGEVTSTTQAGGAGATVNPRTTSYGYDADGNQTSVTDALNARTMDTFNADDERVLATNVDGDSSLTCYDGDRHATQTVPAVGVAANSLSSASCPTSYPSGYGVLLASDASTANWNDAQGFVRQATEPAPTGQTGDETSSYIYDSDGNTVETIDPPASSLSGAADVITLDNYNATGDLVAETTGFATSAAATTTYCYDPGGNETATVPPDGNGTGAAACESSYPWIVSSSQFPVQASYQSTTSYDSLGEGVSTSSPAPSDSASGTTATYFDPAGYKLAVTSPEGNPSSCNPINAGAYADPSAFVPSPCPYTTDTTYGPNGSVLSTTDALGNKTTNTYDAAGQRLSSTDPMSNVTTSTYDVFGETATKTDGAGTTSYFYDNDGHKIAVTTPSGNPASCNPAATSGCPYTTYYTYDGTGMPLETTNSDGKVTADYYDADGNLIAVTGGSGNPYSASNPNGCNPVSTGTCADTAYDSYDNAGKLVGITYTDGTPSVSYAYEPDGLICWSYAGTSTNACTSPPAGAATYSYDAEGRLVSSNNAAGSNMTFAYDASSQLACVSYPNSAGNSCSSAGTPSGVVRYGYDSSGKVDSVTDWAGDTFSVAHLANGKICWVSTYTPQSPACSTPPEQNGYVTTSWSYDGDGRVSGVDTTSGAGPTTLLDLGVGSRNSDELITAETPTIGTTTMATDGYSYDSSDRVASGPVTGIGGNTTYGYTGEGALTQNTTLFASAAYDGNSAVCWTYSGMSGNPCSSPPTAATTYSTNADGERTSMIPPSGNPASFGWNTESGQLTCVNTNGSTCSTTNPTSTTTLYSYDAYGLRTSATNASTTVNFTWDPQSYELASDGTWDFVYLPGASLPLEQIAASPSLATADLLVADANNNVRGLVQLSLGTSQDQLVNYTDYDAFGNPITQAGGASELGGLTVPQTGLHPSWTGSTPFGFGGGYMDNSGLVYLVHRYYDPKTAQFLSVDPIVDVMGQSYTYTSDDPINSTDPSGEWIVYWPTFDEVYSLELPAQSQLWYSLENETHGQNQSRQALNFYIQSGEWNDWFYGSVPYLGGRIVDVYNYGQNTGNEVKVGRQTLDGVNRPDLRSSNWAELWKDYFLLSYPDEISTSQGRWTKMWNATWWIFPKSGALPLSWGANLPFLYSTLSIAPRWQINVMMLVFLPGTPWDDEIFNSYREIDLDLTQQTCAAGQLVIDSWWILRSIPGWNGNDYLNESSPNSSKWYGGCSGAEPPYSNYPIP